MKKQYIMPSLEVMDVHIESLLETVSVSGEINDPSDYTVNAPGFDIWDNEDDTLSDLLE